MVPGYHHTVQHAAWFPQIPIPFYSPLKCWILPLPSLYVLKKAGATLDDDGGQLLVAQYP